MTYAFDVTENASPDSKSLRRAARRLVALQRDIGAQVFQIRWPEFVAAQARILNRQMVHRLRRSCIAGIAPDAPLIVAGRVGIVDSEPLGRPERCAGVSDLNP